MDKNFLNNRIAEIRQEKGISQRELAKAVGTSQANLSRWEKGIVVPSVVECWNIAEYFEVSVDYLIGRNDY